MRLIRASNKFRAANGKGTDTPLELSSDSEDDKGFQSCESEGEASSPRRKLDLGGGGLAAIVAAKQAEVVEGVGKLSVK